MIQSDTTTVYLLFLLFINQRLAFIKIKEYEEWFKERNIKYSFVHVPPWHDRPSRVILRNEDALLFKLTFDV